MSQFYSGHFDQVHILALGGHIDEPRKYSGNMLVLSQHSSFEVIKQVSCSIDQGKEVLRLFELLPDDELYRCYIPGFAIQLRSKSEAVFTAALCWRCNNGVIIGSIALINELTFDGDSEPALKLLSLCEEITGMPKTTSV